MRMIKIFLGITAVVVAMFVAKRMMLKPEATHGSVRANNERTATPEITKLPAQRSVADALIPLPAQQLVVPATNIDTGRGTVTKPDGEKVVPAPAQAKTPKKPLHDPDARVAMSLVGIDPDAETYWLGAIFDSSLPENEREDLMEDLNEEGLSDRKRPGPQDFPVILNRLAIIEKILPHADGFMVTHLGEAYKDLLNLAEITQGGGAPVR